MEAKDIFKNKLVFKMSNIVIFYKVLSFLFFPEMSVFQVGFSNFLCKNLSTILGNDMGWILYKSGAWYAEFKF